MKRLVKKILVTLLILLMLVGIVAPGIEVKAADSVTVTIHYRRYDENYENWTMWIWADGKDGKAYEFTDEDEYGKICVAEIDTTGDVSQIGFIVRLGDWEKKDVEMDRFITLNDDQTEAEIYLLESSVDFFDSEDQVDLTPKIRTATFPKNKQIDFSVTMPYDNSDETDVSRIKVTDQDGNEYEVMKVWSSEPGMISEGTIIMKKELDLGKTYTLEIDGYEDKIVSIGDAFSSASFEEAFYYEGDDLGATYTKEQTDFALWAPTASNVQLNLYADGAGGDVIDVYKMQQGEQGVWRCSIKDDLDKVYYTYAVTVAGLTREAVDPYAKAAGVNGDRGMIVDLEATNPEGWEEDAGPELENEVDAVIYELHVRDLGIDESSGISMPGKFLSLTETGTTNADGLSTGIDHILELGATHVHLLPVFDYSSVDESDLDTPQFNWGYDPENYNVPEGSYSTDPYHGEVRINEMKQMVQALHDNDLGVVMDVVYNHTSATADSNFNKVVPNYYYRKDGDTFLNGSGCGNEVASDRVMVRKYIVESVVYWAKEYHIDGFRFDLMGLMDLETMQAIRTALDEVNPNIIMYGEGWNAGSSGISDGSAALKANTYRLDGIAAFSDDIRDGIKGSVFEEEDPGYASGEEGMVEQIKFGVVGAVEHDEVSYGQPWANAPSQAINYVSAHDNLTLWDKLALSKPSSTVEDRALMNKLAASIVLTSQGVPFFQAGEEILRTKPDGEGGYDENSYKSSDETNAIKWNEKTENIEVFEYYKGLIAFRKNYAGLRLRTTEEINENLHFLTDLPENVVAYTIGTSDTVEEELLIIYNPNEEKVEVNIPTGKWDVYVNADQAGTEKIETISGGKITVDRISAMCLVKRSGVNKGLVAAGIGGAALLAFGALYLAIRKKRR